MSAWIVRTLFADFIRDPGIAAAFKADPDGFLSDRGLSLSDESKNTLKKLADKAAADIGAAGHADVGSHADIDW